MHCTSICFGKHSYYDIVCSTNLFCPLLWSSLSQTCVVAHGLIYVSNIENLQLFQVELFTAFSNTKCSMHLSKRKSLITLVFTRTPKEGNLHIQNTKRYFKHRLRTTISICCAIKNALLRQKYINHVYRSVIIPLIECWRTLLTTTECAAGNPAQLSSDCVIVFSAISWNWIFFS